MPTNFDFEFYSDKSLVVGGLRAEAERRLRALAEGQTDLIGASVAVEEQAKGEDRPHLYRARVVAYARPDNIVAVEKDGTIEAALRGAIDAVERQIRERREKLRKPWEQPS